MAKVTKDNSANPFSIDAGIYEAVVSSIEETVGEHGPYFKWKFKIQDPLRDEKEVDDEVTITGNTPMLLQDDSKLGKWLRACGVDCNDGSSVDTDDAEGATVMVMVENKKGKGKNSDRVFSNVDKVAPTKKKPESKKSDDEAAKKKAAEKAKEKEEAEQKAAEEKEPEESKKEEESEKKEESKEKEEEGLWEFE
jgi:hypothetical protein